MAIKIIPTSTEQSNYRQTTTLEGRDYDLTFEWSQREDRWYLSIASDGTDLVSRLKIVADWPLLRLQTSELVPPGMLMAVDITGQGRSPRLRDLGASVLLMYIESTDFSR